MTPLVPSTTARSAGPRRAAPSRAGAGAWSALPGSDRRRAGQDLGQAGLDLVAGQAAGAQLLVVEVQQPPVEGGRRLDQRLGGVGALQSLEQGVLSVAEAAGPLVQQRDPGPLVRREKVAEQLAGQVRLD